MQLLLGAVATVVLGYLYTVGLHLGLMWTTSAFRDLATKLREKKDVMAQNDKKGAHIWSKVTVARKRKQKN